MGPGGLTISLWMGINAAAGRLGKHRSSPKVMEGSRLTLRVRKGLVLRKMLRSFTYQHSPFLRAIVDRLLPARVCSRERIVSIAGPSQSLQIAGQSLQRARISCFAGEEHFSALFTKQHI